MSMQVCLKNTSCFLLVFSFLFLCKFLSLSPSTQTAVCLLVKGFSFLMSPPAVSCCPFFLYTFNPLFDYFDPRNMGLWFQGRSDSNVTCMFKTPGAYFFCKCIFWVPSKRGTFSESVGVSFFLPQRKGKRVKLYGWWVRINLNSSFYNLKRSGSMWQSKALKSYQDFLLQLYMLH